jgi:hypothetical protein
MYHKNMSPAKDVKASMTIAGYKHLASASNKQLEDL